MASNAKGARYTCVIELEFDIELFLLRVERDPLIIYIGIILGLKQTHVLFICC